jgi:hypothetical protein
MQGMSWYRRSCEMIRSSKVMSLGEGPVGFRRLGLLQELLALNASQAKDGCFKRRDLRPEFLAGLYGWWGFTPELVAEDLLHLITCGVLVQWEDGYVIDGWLEYRPQISQGMAKKNSEAVKQGLPEPFPKAPVWLDAFQRAKAAGQLPEADLDWLLHYCGDSAITSEGSSASSSDGTSARTSDGARERSRSLQKEGRNEGRKDGGGGASSSSSTTILPDVPGTADAAAAADGAGGEPSSGRGPARPPAPPPRGKTGRSVDVRRGELSPTAQELFAELRGRLGGKDGHGLVDLAWTLGHERWRVPWLSELFEHCAAPGSRGTGTALEVLQDEPRRREARAKLERSERETRELERRIDHHFDAEIDQRIREEAAADCADLGMDLERCYELMIAERYRQMVNYGDRQLEQVPARYRKHLASDPKLSVAPRAVARRERKAAEAEAQA